MLSIKKELFQYQVDRHVYVNEEEGKEKITHVQFYNEKSYRAKVVKVETDENGVRSAVIPSVLLKQPYSIMAVGCQRPEEADSQKDYIVITRKSFRVIEQPKPEDYEYRGDQQDEKIPYTSLTKKKKYRTQSKEIVPRTVTIHCHNLIPGKKYKICLEVKSRYQGSTSGQWRHPSHFESDDNPRNFYGYGAWYEVHGASHNAQPVPEWMENSGYVQTEWITDGKGDSYKLVIQPEKVFQNLRKHSNGKWDRLLGVRDSTRHSLLFRFTIFEENQDWFLTKNRTINTLRVGNQEGDQEFWLFGYVSIQ